MFPILFKERHNVSEIYGNAPMPWTPRLTHDGIAIHSGSTVEPGWASHGCNGTPDGFVSKLFAIASKVTGSSSPTASAPMWGLR